MSWWYPIPNVTTISRGYSGLHLGIDFATHAPDPPLPPQPVYASDAGVVVQSNEEGVGFGNVVVLRHEGEWRSLYAHLSELGVGVGDHVAQGQQIGISGGGIGDPGHGTSTGRHLHFQIMDGLGNNSQNTVDPAPLLTMPPNGSPKPPIFDEEADVWFSMKCLETNQVAVVTEFRVAAFPIPEWSGRVDVNCTRAELDAEIRARKELADKL